MIDIVITWVDGSDAAWQKSRNAHSPLKQTDANSSARFRDLDTLRYVLRGIETHMPWVRTIHLVTEGHLPDWIHFVNPKLKHHTHADIFMNRGHLPVFNSNAIEMNFLNIPDLAEKFILFNDDTLVLKDTAETDFFKEGLPCDFLMQNHMKAFFMKIFFTKNVWIRGLFNNTKLINMQYAPRLLARRGGVYFSRLYGVYGNVMNFLGLLVGKYSFFETNHHPQPHLKSIWLEVYEKHSDEMLATSSHRFRDKGDITHYLFRYWALASGRFFPRREKDNAIIHVKGIHSLIDIDRVLRSNTFVCLNDDNALSDAEYPECRARVIKALEEILPTPSSFEK